MVDISVIIPTFGIPQFLEQSIESVKNQAFTNWELIIVDDNDPETTARKATEELVTRHSLADGRIIYLKHDRNKNGAVARNTGFAVAKGKYISLLDSDDEYMPQRLQKCYDVMEHASNEYAGVYTGCDFRRAGRTFHVEKNVKSGNFLVETLACTFEFCTGSNIFVRKQVVDELHGFDPLFLRHQDYEFLVRLFKNYSLLAIPEVLVIKNNENLNLPNVQKQISIKKQYLDKFSNIINSLPKDKQDYIYSSQYKEISENALRMREYDISKEYYNKLKQYGAIPLGYRIRRVIFRMLNILHNGKNI